LRMTPALLIIAPAVQVQKSINRDALHTVYLSIKGYRKP
jgi:hypothetical protein